jgi:predicted enzyme related to lactoylglutathione lyase
VSAELEGLTLGDRPEAWERLGFAVSDGVVAVGGVRLRCAGREDGEGIRAWSLRDAASTDVEGLATEATDTPPPEAVDHPNGAIALDHVVVMTPGFDATRDALGAAGLDLRRERDDLRGVRMAFFRAGPTIVELVENRDAPTASFWGLVVVVSDIDATAALLGDRLGQVKEAVQPGRRIATVHDPEGPSTALAFMSPR